MSKSNLFILVIVILIVVGIVIFTTKSKDNKSTSTDSKQNLTQSKVEDPKIIAANDHILGDPQAQVVLIEYSDLECSYCKLFHSTLHQAVDQYPGKIKWVFRHFPLQFHANAQKEAEASECAASLGGNDAFWIYIDKIFSETSSNGTGFALKDLAPLARNIGLDEKQFRVCVDSGKYASVVETDIVKGKKAGVQGTPATLILNLKTGNSKFLSGAVPLENLKSEIEKLL